MLITWVPGTIFAYYFNVLANRNEIPYHAFVIADYLNACYALYGPLLALIFYTKTLDARRAWIRIFRRVYYGIEDTDVDERSTCTSIISIHDIEIETSDSRAQSDISIGLWRDSSQLKTPLNIQDQDVNPMSSVLRISEEL
jgi:hypothetical protein